MILSAYPAEYLVHLGDQLHFACGQHAQVMITLGQISHTPTEVTELDTGHMFECDVCAHTFAKEHPCR